MQQTQVQPQQETFNQRLPFVVMAMLIVSGILLFRLVSFQQLSTEVVNELSPNYNSTVRLAAARGIIYDWSGQRMAVNTLEYRIGISPILVSNSRRVATQLAGILGQDELQLYEAINTDSAYVLLASRVSAEVGQQIEELDINGIQIEKLPRRSYPQGTLASQILGFVGGDLRGYYGIEGKFHNQLAGRERDEVVSNIPFNVRADERADEGSDIYLTIDRDIQYLVESELALSVAETGAKSGTYIVMNPRTGDIIAMASWPSFDPNAYSNVETPAAWTNPSVSEQYEPGSVMKVLTVAAALELGTISPTFTYNDQGRLDIGGIVVENWDRRAWGVVDTTGILVNSLNVGAATVSRAMGPTDFYKMFSSFGFGRLTGINLEGEASGTMFVPGDSNWSESNLGTNSYGQGIAVTPLQMITSVSALANGGLMMQPNVVSKIVDGDQVINSQPIVLRRVVSESTAREVTAMMVAVVRDGLDEAAQLPGYTVAGKTGTSEIPSPVGYRSDAWIMSFIGYLPADDPQVIVLIKLDEPTTGRWASQVVAPLFRRLAERLVVLMEIPTDDVRLALRSQGGVVNPGP